LRVARPGTPVHGNASARDATSCRSGFGPLDDARRGAAAGRALLDRSDRAAVAHGARRDDAGADAAEDDGATAGDDGGAAGPARSGGSADGTAGPAGVHAVAGAAAAGATADGAEWSGHDGGSSAADRRRDAVMGQLLGAASPMHQRPDDHIGPGGQTPQQERGMTSIEQLLMHLAEINRQQREVYDSRRGMPELTPEEP